MSHGTVSVAQQDDVLVLKFSGALSVGDAFKTSAATDQYVERAFEEGGFEQVAIDLSEVQSLDSTNLGILAHIARLADEHLKHKPTLFSTQPDITTLLSQTALDTVFDIVTTTPQLQADLKAIGLEGDVIEADFSAMVLKAHRALAALSDENKRQFKNVLEIFEDEAQGHNP